MIEASPLMQLCATFGLEDLRDLAREITPLEIEAGGRPRRSVSLGAPSLIELVPGAGLRLRGDARFNWAGFPVTLRAWQVLLRPSVVGRKLAVDPELELLDCKGVPDFFVSKLRSAINDGLASQKQKLAVSFDRLLGVSAMLPPRIQPPRRFEMTPTAVQIAIRADALTITVELAAAFRQTAVVTTAAAPASIRASTPGPATTGPATAFAG